MNKKINNLDLSGYRRTVAVIDIDAIKNNLQKIKDKIGSDTLICPALKANAYGHGAIPIARMIQQENLANYIGVATVDEGIELREAGIKLPILLLGLIMIDEYLRAIQNNITITICSRKHIHHIENIYKINKIQNPIKIHLKVDTGMGRIGCNVNEAIELSETLNSISYIDFEGIFSHFPTSDERDKSFSHKQMDLFENLLKKIEEKGIYIKLKHIANSGANLDLTRSFDSPYNMIRPGILVYGIYPSNETSENIKVTPAMTFLSEIIYIKKVLKGTSLSYGRTYIVKKDTYIATIPAGYGDGVNRLLSNNGQVVINNKRYNIVGRVCMDQLLIDLGDDKYDVGTRVSFFDQQNLTVSEIARKLNTIPYEVLCWVSERVKRIYI